MSLVLNCGTRPENASALIIPGDGPGKPERLVLRVPFAAREIAKITNGNLSGLFDVDIAGEDFCALVLYWLTNTDLYHNDPRQQLLTAIAGMQTIPGYNRGRMRLGDPASIDDAPDVLAEPVEEEASPFTPRPRPGIREEVRLLGSGEYCYSGRHIDVIANALRHGDANNAAIMLKKAAAGLGGLPMYEGQVTCLRLTGPGDEGSRGIAFKYQ